LNHRSTNTGLGITTSAPRGGDIKDKEREVRTGRSQGSRPSGHARTKGHFFFSFTERVASDSAPSEGEGSTLGDETDNDDLEGGDDDFDY